MGKWAPALQITVVGFYVAASLLIPTAIGYWLDNYKLNTMPWLTLAGLLIGTVIMVFGVYRMFKQAQASMDKVGKTEGKKS